MNERPDPKARLSANVRVKLSKWLGIALRTCHGGRGMANGLFGLAIECHAGPGKAIDSFRERRAALCGLDPDVTRYCDRIRVIVATEGDSSDFRPALKGE